MISRNLKSDIWQIWKILISCKDNYLYSRYLNIPDSQEELEYLNYSPHFRFLRHSLWRLCIIELHKILSKSDNDFYNVWTFLKNLKANNYEQHNVPSLNIVEWEKMLFSKKKTIRKITLLRNKLYAHTDADLEVLNFDITFDEVKELINIVEDVIQGIYYHSFNASIQKKTPFFERRGFDIINILVKERKMRREEMIKLANARKPQFK